MKTKAGKFWVANLILLLLIEVVLGFVVASPGKDFDTSKFSIERSTSQQISVDPQTGRIEVTQEDIKEEEEKVPQTLASIIVPIYIAVVVLGAVAYIGASS